MERPGIAMAVLENVVHHLTRFFYLGTLWYKQNFGVSYCSGKPSIYAEKMGHNSSLDIWWWILFEVSTWRPLTDMFGPVQVQMQRVQSLLCRALRIECLQANFLGWIYIHVQCLSCQHTSQVDWNIYLTHWFRNLDFRSGHNIDPLCQIQQLIILI